MPPPPARLLPSLSAAFAPLADDAAKGNPLSTADFTRATAELLPLFDSLGERELVEVLSVEKGDGIGASRGLEKGPCEAACALVLFFSSF